MDFKEGDVYYAKTPIYTSIRRLSQDGDALRSTSRIVVEHFSSAPNVKFLITAASSKFLGTEIVRLAYPHEVYWLEECEKAGELVKPYGSRIMPYEDKNEYPAVYDPLYKIGDIVKVLNDGLVFPTHPVRQAFGFSSDYTVAKNSFLKIVSITSINDRVRVVIGQDVVNPTEHVIIDINGITLATGSEARYFNEELERLLKKVNAFQPVMETQQSNNNQDGNTEISPTIPIKIERLVPRVTSGQRPTGSTIRARTSKRTVESRCIIYNQSVIRG